MADADNPQSEQKFQTLRGFMDVLPEDHEYFTLIKKAVRHRARQAGLRRISTPYLEETGVFVRGLGESTDVVSKELFTLESRSGKLMSLKPEGTAGAVRAYIEHGMHTLPQPVQFYYIEPHFRYDRPQKGRFRQFHQYGFEIIGERDPSIDAQVIHIAWKILKDMGIDKRFDLQINTLGTPTARGEYISALKNYFYGKERHLCSDCQNRLESNPLRLLDCKEEDCQILSSLAPKMQEYLDQESTDFYESLKAYLVELEVPFYENPRLVRGLDYYTDTVFEFWDRSQGAQNAIGGGGRYDGLVEKLGGTHTPAFGCAFGMERVMMHLKEAGITPPPKDRIHVFVAQLGEEAKKKAMRLVSDLREEGIHTMGAMGKSSMKAQLKMADKFGVDWTVILGEVEVRNGTAIIRDMEHGRQEIVPMNTIIPEIIKLVGAEKRDRYELGE
ncbi:MAG: histidine--tRNA ligase [Candidatus Peregrinibacteria bacterium]